MSDNKFVQYETLDEGTIARITLNRPEARNAQNRGLLVELHDAFLQAEADDQVRVVILCGAGPLFSAGHDMGSKVSMEEFAPGPNQHPTRQINGGTRKAAESLMLQEWHYFFENTRRWRNLRKITIGQAHGDIYAAGMMILWACDLIVAGQGTTFADVVGARLGMCGVEYFAHPWEFGPRKAKELLLTGDSVSAEEAHALGMVSKIFPADELADRTLDYARRINGGTRSGAEQRMLQEWHYYFENTRRWRNLRKITIGQAHGDVYAAGLMLLWACDLIVCAEGTRFTDVVGARLGMCGVEYFAHPWEFGPRKAKELLLTGDSIDADEAHALGMVSKVFPAEQLGDRTLDFARRISQLPTVTSLLIKEAVNQTVDNMGFYNALNACFTLHELNHSHWAQVNDDGYPVAKEDSGIPNWREAPPIVPAVKDKVRADPTPQ